MFVTFIFSVNGETHFGKILYGNQKINYNVVKNDVLYVINLIDKKNGFYNLSYDEFSIGILNTSDIIISSLEEVKNFKIYIDKTNNIYNYYFDSNLIKTIDTFDSEFDSDTELESDTETDSDIYLEIDNNLYLEFDNNLDLDSD